MKLLQLSYSELGPPCFAAGGPHRASTLIFSCLTVWQQSQKAAAAAARYLQVRQPQGPPSFVSFFLSKGLGAPTLLPVPTQRGVGQLLEARGGLGGPPCGPFGISPLLQQLPCINLQQLLRLLQLLARELAAEGPQGALHDYLGALVLQQLETAFSFRVSVQCVESRHPFGQHQESRSVVSFLPCRRLLLLVDPRTDLGGSDEGCCLSISKDEAYEAEVFSIKQSGELPATRDTTS